MSDVLLEQIFKLTSELGEVKGRLTALEEEIAELKSRPAGKSESGGRWETVGDNYHTITAIGRAKDSQQNQLLLFWSEGAKFAIPYWWWNDKDKKDEILVQIEALSGVKYAEMPWIADTKAENLKSLLKACKSFVMHQVVKKKGDSKPKYFVEGFAPLQAATASTTKTAQTPASASITFPAERNYNLDAKILLAYKQHGIPEEKARAVLQPVLDQTQADMCLAYLGRVVTLNAELLKKGFFVPAAEEDMHSLYQYGYEMYELSEPQVKKIISWLSQTKLRGDIGLPQELSQLKIWHFEYAIDLAHQEAKA